LDRRPAPAELDAERIGEALVLGNLAAVEGEDALMGEFQRFERRLRAGRDGGVDLLGGDPEARPLDVYAVEAQRIFHQRRVAARASAMILAAASSTSAAASRLAASRSANFGSKSAAPASRNIAIRYSAATAVAAKALRRACQLLAAASPRLPLRIAHTGVELLHQVERGLRDHRAGREDRIHPGVAQRLEILLGDDAADDQHGLAETHLLQRLFQRRGQRQMPRRQRGDADDMAIRLLGERRDLLGGGEQWPDLDL